MAVEIQTCVIPGIQLLQKMGWRQGKGIGEAFGHKLDSGWGPEASLSQQRSHVWHEKPKVQLISDWSDFMARR